MQCNSATIGKHGAPESFKAVGLAFELWRVFRKSTKFDKYSVGPEI